MSKYYGESERLLGKVFSLANELSAGAIIFLDEVKGLIISFFFFLFKIMIIITILLLLLFLNYYYYFLTIFIFI